MTAREKLKLLKPGTKIRTSSGKSFTVIFGLNFNTYAAGKENMLLSEEYEVLLAGNHILLNYDWETQFIIIKDEVHVSN